MSWTVERGAFLHDAPWPAVTEKLIDFAERSGGPINLTESLETLPDDGRAYESAEELHPTAGEDDFVFEE